VQLRKISELPGARAADPRPAPAQLAAAPHGGGSRTYGEYFRFRIGPQPIIAVANPETIAALLRDRPDGFHRSERLSAIAEDMGFNGVFSANGDAWRRQRPMVMASFDPRHIKAYFPALAKVTERFEKRWRRAAAAGETIDLQADLMR
jgi:cytochrome P450